jgi:uncharacterized membrane protein
MAPGIDLGGIGSQLIQWVINPILWAVILFGLAIIAFGILHIRKRNKLKYQCIEIVRYGDSNRYGFNVIPCGWFGKNKRLFGLLDYGPEIMKTKTGEQIVGFSTDDYQEVNGKRGVIVFRDPLNQNILAPIDKISIKGSEMLNAIAPQDFRDVAQSLMNDAEAETQDKNMKMAQMVLVGAAVVVFLIAIIMILQYAKHVTDQSAETLTTASSTCLSNAKTICSEICTNAHSSFGSSSSTLVVPGP